MKILKGKYQKKKWQYRLYTFFICMILICIGIAIILKVFNENVIFYYSTTELASKDLNKLKNPCRVGGLVKNGSIKKEDNNQIEFIITDLSTELRVIYIGLPPNLFKENQGVVALGYLNNERNFVATEILAKHDENYMPKEVADSIKKSGNWQQLQQSTLH